MIDRRFVGHALPVFHVKVEASKLRFFAKATGQTDPIYSDEAAAKQAGHPALPVPPTFLYCLEADCPDPAAIRELLKIDYRYALHGEQRFHYHRMAYAGDVLKFEQRIADIYEKKSGALDFVVRETKVSNERGEHVADLHGVLVVRNK